MQSGSAKVTRLKCLSYSKGENKGLFELLFNFTDRAFFFLLYGVKLISLGKVYFSSFLIFPKG